ncbi:RRM domain-containing protein [Trichostrongylus colubriformis]|uniref:RRM domain-containing protein n=1 Tax=Trichostrongylus colubriformis TaxID=6319 RepID=A0AAN8FQ78_TRICO
MMIASRGMVTPTVPAGEEKAHGQADGCVNQVVQHSEFVVVSDKSGEPIELPTASDNTLFMATLQASFPGATGLKYKNPKTGALRGVAVEASGTKLLPPPDGWDDKVFLVITPNARSARGSDVSVKRRKISTSDGDSDSDGEGRVGRKRTADDWDSVNKPSLPRRPVDLLVLDVNYKTTDETFKKYFEAFGTVTFAEIKRTAQGTSKGFGFVQMSTVEEEDKVMAMDHVIDGRHCQVRIPDKKKNNSGENQTTGSRKTLINKIYVGRLTEKITEERLREFFNREAKQIKESASVTNVLIPSPFRGFAFVTFTHSEVADRMVKVNNFIIDDVSVVVTFAVSRENPQQAGSSQQNVTPGYTSEFASVYGFGNSNAGYDETSMGLTPFAAREMYGYSSPSGMYPPPSASSPTIHGTPRDGRGVGGAHEQARSRHLATGNQPVPFPSLQQGMQGPPRVVPPMPYMYPRDGVGKAAPSQIASGLDALNLNQKNPELLSAAWTAFFKTLNHGGTPQPRKQY